MADRKQTTLRYSDIQGAELSPMMQEYLEERKKRPDCLLLYRLGDFFELFFDDAITASKELGLTLTQRDCGLPERAPMCGVPHHAAESYISRLVENGHKVAICEQVEDPALAKGLVKREVIRVVTPGTLTDPNALEATRYRYIASICLIDARYIALAFADLSSTRFLASEIIYGNSERKLSDELDRMEPAEIICNTAFAESELCKDYLKAHSCSLSIQADNCFSSTIISQYSALTSFEDRLWPRAMAALLNYIEQSAFSLPEPMPEIQIYQVEGAMILDQTARRHLEIFETLRERKVRGSLFWALNCCQTSMGSRLLRQWLERPLLNPADILERQEAIAAFKASFVQRSKIRELLAGVYDLERLAGKLSMSSANPRDLSSMAHILERLPELKKLLGEMEDPTLQSLAEEINPLTELSQKLLSSLVEDPPTQLKEGGIFRDGARKEIDAVREAAQHGQQWLLEYEQQQKEATGIKNLKLRYNRVFGYSIEISKGSTAMAPENYQRKQTLVNAERYITPELKEMEERILGAEQKSLSLEYACFVELRNEAAQDLLVLRRDAALLARIDLLSSMGDLAERENYVPPEITEEAVLQIEEGRHPVIERILDKGAFVPNDLKLDTQDRRLMILTGPNMAGKSTYMRQAALIVLMAQAGLFVPAKHALIGICDQIFTRVGAADDLFSGQSTFMVEMSEVAHIMKEASVRSLLILDEIGRGTSTWDGLSIAWSVIEHCANREALGCRCIFATHYHELTELEGSIEGVFNAHVDILREKSELVFLHKVQPGGSDNSYGIDVASLAGVPESITQRAETVMRMLEKENKGKRLQIKKSSQPLEGQIDLFTAASQWQKGDDILSELREVDINLLRPVDALSLLAELREKALKAETQKEKP